MVQGFGVAQRIGFSARPAVISNCFFMTACEMARLHVTVCDVRHRTWGSMDAGLLPSRPLSPPIVGVEAILFCAGSLPVLASRHSCMGFHPTNPRAGSIRGPSQGGVRWSSTSASGGPARSQQEKASGTISVTRVAGGVVPVSSAIRRQRAASAQCLRQSEPGLPGCRYDYALYVCVCLPDRCSCASRCRRPCIGRVSHGGGTSRACRRRCHARGGLRA